MIRAIGPRVLELPAAEWRALGKPSAIVLTAEDHYFLRTAIRWVDTVGDLVRLSVDQPVDDVPPGCAVRAE